MSGLAPPVPSGGSVFALAPRVSKQRLSSREAAGITSAVLLVIACLACPRDVHSGDSPPAYPEHQDLSYVIDGAGRRSAMAAPADWERRREHVLANVQRVMGPLPALDRSVPLNMAIAADGPLEGSPGVRLRRITFQAEQNAPAVPALLLTPADWRSGDPPRPAVLCLHQTTSIGKGEPAGLGGLPNLHYARELSERGYVALAPDYPSFGDYDYDFHVAPHYASGSMKAIVDNIRGVDLLQSLPEVDPERIGCIGHSLGGHNAIFTAVFEPRIRAVASSCGFTRFHKYYAGDLTGWTSPRYMPRIAAEFGADPDRVPFDFPELIAALAPRPFFASAPVGDDNFDCSGVRDVFEAARPIYGLYGAESELQLQTPDCGHDFPPESRQAAYEFLDRALRTTPPAAP